MILKILLVLMVLVFLVVQVDLVELGPLVLVNPVKTEDNRGISGPSALGEGTVRQRANKEGLK